MELYERVDEIIKAMGRSRAHLAKRLDIKQTTFNHWFSRGRQHNLWPVLLKILELHPQVSREWLFFGEGEMRKNGRDEPTISQNREKELLLKIEQLSGLLVRLGNQAAPLRL